jgi:glycosyltransferase involved in cell wall biosynthesis
MNNYEKIIGVNSVLYVVWTSSSLGGAQSIGADLCGENGIYLSISKELTSCNIVGVWEKILIAMDKTEVVLVNDYRASMFFFPILFYRRFIKRYHNKVYVVIHSDRPNKASFIVYILSKLKAKLIVTTNVQYDKFISYSPILVRIMKGKKHNSNFYPKKILFSFIYFGRISIEKQIIEMAYLLNDILKARSWSLTIIGTGDKYIIDKLNFIFPDNVRFINKWLKHDELASICRENTFVISNTKYEGASLQIIEGVRFGCVPLVRSVGILTTLKLPWYCDLDNIDYYLNNDVGAYEIQDIYVKSCFGVNDYFNLPYIGDVIWE